MPPIGTKGPNVRTAIRHRGAQARAGTTSQGGAGYSGTSLRAPQGRSNPVPTSIDGRSILPRRSALGNGALITVHRRKNMPMGPLALTARAATADEVTFRHPLRDQLPQAWPVTPVVVSTDAENAVKVQIKLSPETVHYKLAWLFAHVHEVFEGDIAQMRDAIFTELADDWSTADLDHLLNVLPADIRASTQPEVLFDEFIAPAYARWTMAQDVASHMDRPQASRLLDAPLPALAERLNRFAEAVHDRIVTGEVMLAQIGTGPSLTVVAAIIHQDFPDIDPAVQEVLVTTYRAVVERYERAMTRYHAHIESAVNARMLRAQLASIREVSSAFVPEAVRALADDAAAVQGALEQVAPLLTLPPYGVPLTVIQTFVQRVLAAVQHLPAASTATIVTPAMLASIQAAAAAEASAMAAVAIPHADAAQRAKALAARPTAAPAERERDDVVDAPLVAAPAEAAQADADAQSDSGTTLPEPVLAEEVLDAPIPPAAAVMETQATTEAPAVATPQANAASLAKAPVSSADTPVAALPPMARSIDEGALELARCFIGTNYDGSHMQQMRKILQVAGLPLYQIVYGHMVELQDAIHNTFPTYDYRAKRRVRVTVLKDLAGAIGKRAKYPSVEWLTDRVAKIMKKKIQETIHGHIDRAVSKLNLATDLQNTMVAMLSRAWPIMMTLTRERLDGFDAILRSFVQGWQGTHVGEARALMYGLLGERVFNDISARYAEIPPGYHEQVLLVMADALRKATDPKKIESAASNYEGLLQAAQLTELHHSDTVIRLLTFAMVDALRFSDRLADDQRRSIFEDAATYAMRLSWSAGMHELSIRLRSMRSQLEAVQRFVSERQEAVLLAAKAAEPVQVTGAELVTELARLAEELQGFRDARDALPEDFAREAFDALYARLARDLDRWRGPSVQQVEADLLEMLELEIDDAMGTLRTALQQYTLAREAKIVAARGVLYRSGIYRRVLKGVDGHTDQALRILDRFLAEQSPELLEDLVRLAGASDEDAEAMHKRQQELPKIFDRWKGKRSYAQLVRTEDAAAAPVVRRLDDGPTQAHIDAAVDHFKHELDLKEARGDVPNGFRDFETRYKTFLQIHVQRALQDIYRPYIDTAIEEGKHRAKGEALKKRAHEFCAERLRHPTNPFSTSAHGESLRDLIIDILQYLGEL